jgi:hypothetical protein
MASFQRVSGIICLYLLAVRRWEVEEANHSPTLPDAYQALCGAEGLVTELLHKENLGPAATHLLSIFVEEWHYTCRRVIIGRDAVLTTPSFSDSRPIRKACSPVNSEL